MIRRPLRYKADFPFRDDSNTRIVEPPSHQAAIIAPRVQKSLLLLFLVPWSTSEWLITASPLCVKVKVSPTRSDGTRMSEENVVRSGNHPRSHYSRNSTCNVPGNEWLGIFLLGRRTGY